MCPLLGNTGTWGLLPAYRLFQHDGWEFEGDGVLRTLLTIHNIVLGILGVIPILGNITEAGRLIGWSIADVYIEKIIENNIIRGSYQAEARKLVKCQKTHGFIGMFPLVGPITNLGIGIIATITDSLADSSDLLAHDNGLAYD